MTAPRDGAARALGIEAAVLFAAVAAAALFAYAPRAERADVLLRELDRETAENEALGAALAGQGDVAEEIRALDAVAARFRATRLAPGQRGETSTRLRRLASRHGLSVAREGAWAGVPSDAAAATILRKEVSLRGPFPACESFVAEIEADDGGFVVERLSVARDPDGRAPAAGGSALVSMDLRLLAVERRSAGAE